MLCMLSEEQTDIDLKAILAISPPDFGFAINTLSADRQTGLIYRILRNKRTGAFAKVYLIP